MEHASQTEGRQTQPASAMLRSKSATMTDHSPGGDRLRGLGQLINGSSAVQRLHAVSDNIQRQDLEEKELVQTKSAAPAQVNNSGLPANLKSGIESLSGLSMDHVQVHRNSSKPAQLNARAFAQGSDIHLAPGQDQHLPQEAWHVVQQAQGRVKPTMQLKGGVPVNDDAGLEREADVMGAWAVVQSFQRRSPGDIAIMEQTPDVLQRSVTDFEVDSVQYGPPGIDILETIDDSDFTQTTKQISNKVRTSLNDPLVKTLSVPERVTALLEQSPKGVSHPARGSRSRNIGLIGRDEFRLKTGSSENFEGGHIIPHALWDDDDNDVDFAGSYVNLVPMSRTLNVMAWAGKEVEIKDKLASIDAGDQLEVVIDIGHQEYSLTNQESANRFDLNVKIGRDPNKSNWLYGWNLTSASVNWTHIETGSDMELSDVEENNLRNTHAEIEDAEELIKQLKESGFWMRMSGILKQQLESL
jgi:hypothetical protein